jgi:hypothetical protein
LGRTEATGCDDVILSYLILSLHTNLISEDIMGALGAHTPRSIRAYGRRLNYRKARISDLSFSCIARLRSIRFAIVTTAPNLRAISSLIVWAMNMLKFILSGSEFCCSNHLTASK